MKSDPPPGTSPRHASLKTGTSANPMMDVFDLIDLIARKGERIVTQTVGDAGLTPAQYLVLANLPEKEGRPLREIAESLRCSPSTVTGIVDTMEKKQLVARQPNPADRRSHLLRLTARGRALRRSTPGLDEFYEGCTLGMSRDEFERLRSLLLRLDECLKAAVVGP